MFLINRRGIQLVQIMVITLATLAIALIFVAKLTTNGAANAIGNAETSAANYLNSANNAFQQNLP